MKEINPLRQRPNPPDYWTGRVSLRYNDFDRTYTVEMPKRGYLGDTTLLDGETGLPVDITDIVARFVRYTKSEDNALRAVFAFFHSVDARMHKFPVE